MTYAMHKASGVKSRMNSWQQRQQQLEEEKKTTAPLVTADLAVHATLFTEGGAASDPVQLIQEIPKASAPLAPAEPLPAPATPLKASQDGSEAHAGAPPEEGRIPPCVIHCISLLWENDPAHVPVRPVGTTPFPTPKRASTPTQPSENQCAERPAWKSARKW